MVKYINILKRSVHGKKYGVGLCLGETRAKALSRQQEYSSQWLMAHENVINVVMNLDVN